MNSHKTSIESHRIPEGQLPTLEWEPGDAPGAMAPGSVLRLCGLAEVIAMGQSLFLGNYGLLLSQDYPIIIPFMYIYGT